MRKRCRLFLQESKNVRCDEAGINLANFLLVTGQSARGAPEGEKQLVPVLCGFLS